MAEGGVFPSFTGASGIEATADPRQWRIIKGDPEVYGVWLMDRFYPVARKENLGLGFQEGLLGAGYAATWWDRSDWLAPLPQSLADFFRNKKDRSRFYVVTRNLSENEPGQAVPLFTLAKTDAGQVVVLELNPDFDDRQEIYLSLAWYGLVQANTPYTRHRFDAYGDFMRLGAFSQVDRHNTELTRKHLSQRINFEEEGCTHCLKCATFCSEMRVRLTSEGLKVLGPAENYCTVCRLCLEHCPHLEEVGKEDLPPDRKASPGAHFTGGEAIYLTQQAAQEAHACFQGLADSQGNGDNWRITSIYQGTSWDAAASEAEIRQYSLEDHRPDSCYKPLLITVYLSPPGGPAPPLLIFRLRSRVAVFLTTATGAIEAELLRRLDSLGVLYQGVVNREKFGSLGDMPLAPKLHRLNRLAQDANLAALVTSRQVDVVLTPFLEELPTPVSAYFLQTTGNLANLLAPQIFQAFTFSPEPLLNELRELCLEVFPRYPELLTAEAERARTYLADLPRYGAEIHARYRTWGMAPGHSACPTCAELQTLSVPLYMAMLLSLARRQVPQVTFTCETGCMSETLNKVKEVAQKVKGGRTGRRLGDRAAGLAQCPSAAGLFDQRPGGAGTPFH
ncbi:MAG: hypothetical protein P8168_05355 [Deltaproteobacteria bacterium]